MPHPLASHLAPLIDRDVGELQAIVAHWVVSEPDEFERARYRTFGAELRALKARIERRPTRPSDEEIENRTHGASRGRRSARTHDAVVTPSFAETELAQIEPSRLVKRAPSPVAEAGDALALCRAALESPTGPSIAEHGAGARRIAVIVSDASRDEPRAALLTALREVLPWERVTLVVASGTHTGDDSVVPPGFRDRPVVVHDARDESQTVDLGRTAEGTRVRLQKAVVEADLVVVTGRIRPHYFAGYSGGVKGLFPGCALAEDALANHQLKADPTARLGRVDDNRCRLDMEAAALKAPGLVAALNVLCDVEGNAVAAKSGDPVAAHRELCRLARALFEVRAPRARVVVVADRPPVTCSLYQASKLLPPAGSLLEPGGTVIVLAECDRGTGPLTRVNEGIYELGVRRQLPAQHRVVLVSKLAPEVVRRTYAQPAESLRDALDGAGAERAVVLWRAGECIAVAGD